MHIASLRELTGLLLCLVIGGTAGAADWTRYRGPNGTGTATDKAIPIQFSATTGVLWKVSLPGEGNGSPIVLGGKIFLQDASTDGAERHMLCLSTNDGKTLWSRSVLGNTAKIHKKNSLASSTPTTDGERVYGLFWDGKEISLSAYDLSGELVWTRNLGGYVSQHGVGASPIVFKGKLFLLNDQDGASAVLAFDAKTGTPAWTAQRAPFRACYGTPFVLEKPGAQPELIVTTTGGVTSYRPDTGDVVWDWKWAFDNMALRVVGSPVTSHGTVFTAAGDGSGACHMVAVKLGGSGDVTKKNLAWEKKKGLPYVPSMLTFGDHLYYVTDRGFAGCCVAATGKEVWTERLGGGITSSPVLIDGKIYACGEDGQVYVYPAAPKYKLLSKNNLGEGIMSTPAVADNRLYIRTASHLYCIGKTK